jgi:hypothetical protein
MQLKSLLIESLGPVIMTEHLIALGYLLKKQTLCKVIGCVMSEFEGSQDMRQIILPGISVVMSWMGINVVQPM